MRGSERGTAGSAEPCHGRLWRGGFVRIARALWGRGGETGEIGELPVDETKRM